MLLWEKKKSLEYLAIRGLCVANLLSSAQDLTMTGVHHCQKHFPETKTQSVSDITNCGAATPRCMDVVLHTMHLWSLQPSFYS